MHSTYILHWNGWNYIICLIYAGPKPTAIGEPIFYYSV